MQHSGYIPTEDDATVIKVFTDLFSEYPTDAMNLLGNEHMWNSPERKQYVIDVLISAGLIFRCPNCQELLTAPNQPHGTCVEKIVDNTVPEVVDYVYEELVDPDPCRGLGCPLRGTDGCRKK